MSCYSLFCRCGVLASLLLARADVALGDSRDLGAVERWQPLEVSVKANVNADNPFLVTFQAKVTDPHGRQLTLPGFYDGENRWKLRVMPHTPGEWQLETRSTESQLDKQEFRFTCTAVRRSNQHGRLRVDPEHPHHFVFEDGTRYFMLAYECDWLWALDAGNPKLPQTKRFLNRIGSHGFNSVLVDVFAYDTGWRPGRTSADDLGPPALMPWAGSAGKPDHERLNLPFWRHYDRMMRALHERGIVTHLLIKVYNKRVRWPERGSRADDLFFRTLIARYGAYPGVIWDIAKEAYNEKSLRYKVDRLRFIQHNDPFDHLLTVHDDDKRYEAGDYKGLIDFRTDQQHSHLRTKILQQRSLHSFPVLNAEFGYEHGSGGLKDVTYGVAQTPEELVRRAWEISFAGGYTAYYHTHTAWDVLRPDINPPGYELFGRMRRFLETTNYWQLSPGREYTSGVQVLQNPGKEYVVWLPPGATAQLTIPASAGRMHARWFMPFGGKRSVLDDVSPGERTFASPPEAAGRPVILHLRSASILR